MRKTFSWALAAALLFTACSKGSDNPLLGATDGQFIATMNFATTECEEAFFNPEKVRHPYPNQKNNCAHRVKSNAAFAGIPDVVTLEHIEDPKVKERYFSLKK